MRTISTGVAAAFLFASAFGAVAAPSASSPQGMTGTPAVLVAQDAGAQNTPAAQPQKPMTHKSSMHRKGYSHRAAMRHKKPYYRTSLHHMKPAHHPTKRAAKAAKGAGASTY